MRRSIGLFVVCVVVLAVAGSAAPAGGPVLLVGPEVPADVTALAERTWNRFLATFPARRACLPDLRLETSRELADRGRYEPDRRVVTLRIPHTAPRLERTLVHEFAHHLEFSCPEHQQVRASFLAAQGHDPATPWLGDPAALSRPSQRWAAIPSEQWAEVVAELVLGPGTGNPTVTVSPEAGGVVAGWARGG